jgi:ribonuclease HI
VPIIWVIQQDRLTWVGNSTGVFTVRSAYHLGKERMSRDRGESSRNSRTVRVWRKIWKLNVPRAVQNFMWRVCSNTLPTRANLFKKHIITDNLCPICGLFPETVEHIIWECKSAADVWMECKSNIQKLSIQVNDGFNFFEQLMDILDDSDLALVSTIARRIWLRRNSFLFEGVFLPPGQLFLQSIVAMEDFNSASVSVASARERTLTLPMPRWKKPDEGMIKANWDAALDIQTQRMGVGTVLRDAAGRVLAAMCCSIPFINEPSTAEAIALWKAVSFCVELGIPRLHMEGDSLEVVQALQQPESCWSRYGQLIDDTRSRLDSTQEWCISHTRREANEAAHQMAKAAIFQSLDCVWKDSYPDFIQSIVLAEQDVNSIH